MQSREQISMPSFFQRNLSSNEKGKKRNEQKTESTFVALSNQDISSFTFIARILFERVSKFSLKMTRSLIRLGLVLVSYRRGIKKKKWERMRWLTTIPYHPTVSRMTDTDPFRTKRWFDCSKWPGKKKRDRSYRSTPRYALTSNSVKISR